MKKPSSLSEKLVNVRIDFYCPISKCVFKKPVIAADDFTYEEAELKRWLKKSNVSPMTLQSLAHKHWQTNQTLKNLIDSCISNNLLDKKEQYGGSNPRKEKKDVIHFIKLKNGVQANFLEHSGKLVSDDLLDWLYQHHNDLFRYLYDQQKSIVLKVFSFNNVSEKDIRLSFDTWQILIQRFGSIEELFQLPIALVRRLLENASLVHDDNNQRQNEEKSSDKATLKIEEKLQKLGIASLNEFKVKIMPQKTNMDLCENIFNLLKGWIGYPTKIMGQPISKNSKKTIDLFDLAKLPVKVVENIARHPIALETVLLNEYISWKEFSQTPEKILLTILDSLQANSFSRSAANLLNTEKVTWQELINTPKSTLTLILKGSVSVKTLLEDTQIQYIDLTKAPDDKLKIILKESASVIGLLNTNKIKWKDLTSLPEDKLKIILRNSSKIGLFLDKGITFETLDKVDIQTIELLIADDKRTTDIPVTSFFNATKVPITLLNNVNSDHPALNWFLSNIHSLKLVYKDDDWFKNLIDDNIKYESLNFNEWLDLISGYKDWPENCNITPFQTKETKDSELSSISENETETLYQDEKVIERINEEEEEAPLVQETDIQHAILEKKLPVSMMQSYSESYKIRQEPTKRDDRQGDNCLIFVLGTYLMALGCGAGGEAYYLFTQYKKIQYNKALAIGLLSVAVMLFLIGFIIQLAKDKQSKQQDFCCLKTLTHIIFFGGILSLAGSATSLYFDCNKLNLVLFIAAASLIMISAVSALLINHLSAKSNGPTS